VAGSRGAATALLKRPGVAVRAGKAGEARIVAAAHSLDTTLGPRFEVRASPFDNFRLFVPARDRTLNEPDSLLCCAETSGADHRESIAMTSTCE